MSSSPSFSDRLAVLPQYLIPKQALTAFAGWVAGSEWGGATTGIINWFVQRYNVNMGEGGQPGHSQLQELQPSFSPARCGAMPGRWRQQTL